MKRKNVHETLDIYQVMNVGFLPLREVVRRSLFVFRKNMKNGRSYVIIGGFVFFAFNE